MLVEGRGKALGCLSSTNPLRRFCLYLRNHDHFDNIIMVFIVFSTILLAWESPLDDPYSVKTQNLLIFDYVMTGIFSVEMLIKICALGFILNGSKSYLKDAWNILDFFIVMSSILSISFEGLGLNFLKVLRLFRILRPLRLISRNKQLKLAIISLLKSIPAIINLLFIVGFFIFLMGILGMTLFKGKFFNCSLTEIEGL